jgi:DNA invertase Pin-like site-specific DNA recombinase
MSVGYTRKMGGTRNGAGGHARPRAADRELRGVSVVHYVRISTEEQKKGYSTRDQRRRLQEHSESAGHNVVDVIVEEGDSGANPFRAGVERILKLAEAGAIREVWDTKRDCFFRWRLYRLQLDEDLKGLGVSLRALDDTGNRFVDAIKDEYAEEEREVIRDRTRSGRIERARQGEVVAGVAPYGFRFTPDRKNFEVEEGEAAVVRKVFSMAASGTGLSSIASSLTAGGVPTPRGERGAKSSGDGKTWSHLVIRQMVLSDCYLLHSPADFEVLPEFAASLARDLPHLTDSLRVIRDYETIGAERTEENPFGIYKLTPDRIWHLPAEEVERREREAEDERAARYRAMYADLGLRVVARPDGTLEATWRFGEATLRVGSDTSKNKHAAKHFHATSHPLVRSFQPGEDWIWCYVDEVVMTPR